MPLFSEAISSKTPTDQRRLYTLFQRAVKAGDIPALKLITRFELTGSRGQTRQVFDYAYTFASAGQIKAWMDSQKKIPNAKGVAVEDLETMTDAQLNALIKAQRKPVKRRNGKRKNTVVDRSGDGT
ncbi:hypothetical protein [Deinococcus sp. UR1]|uniref:hypothetical protein n=1 Tax=Deinococcus sp. UR1 TaxID=1704277 RepID=UPI0011AF68F7|nr:hypothetical protein [Deinococcus sp. UR1]